MNHRYVVLDLETTGNSPIKNEKIIQVGAVLIENGEITERFASFVNPQTLIPPFIEQLTGISNELVKNAPTFELIAPMLLEMLEGSSLVAHNVPFDLSFLQHELKINGFKPFNGKAIDTVELSRILLPTQVSYKLNDLASHYSFQHENPHRADSDAEVTAYIFLELLEKIEKLPAKTVKKLRKLCKSLKSDIYYVFKQRESRSEINEEQFYMYESIIIKKVEECSQTLFNDNFNVTSNDENVLSKQISNFLNNREHALVELPTDWIWRENYANGILQFMSSSNDKKLLISTNSSPLQNQLFHYLNKESKIRTSVIKDRKYYINIDRFVRVLHNKDENYDSILTKAQILVWLTETVTGDVEELSLTSGGKLLWDMINSKWLVDERNVELDYFQQSLNRAKESTIIITNHSYLVDSLIHNNELLIGCDYIVIEEANAFLSTYRKNTGISIDYLTFYFLLSRLKPSLIVESAKEELNEAFTIMRDFCLAKGKENVNKAYYLFSKGKDTTDWEAVQEAFRRLLLKLKELIVLLEIEQEEQENTLLEIKRYYKDLKFVVFENNAYLQTWLETDVKGAKNSISINSMPINIGESMALNLFQAKSSVILIDDALEAEDQFQYMINEFGLNDFYPSTISWLDSLNHHVTLHVPDDSPLITEVPEKEWTEYVSLQIKEIIFRKNGRIIISFSSLEMLNQVHDLLKVQSIDNVVILSQGNISGSKQKLVKSLMNFTNVVLLVTHQFLEEISLNSEEVNTLIVVRLPFKAVNEPVMSAKIEQIEKENGNAFTELSLPLAIIKYKKIIQSFINPDIEQDIVILDGRVIRKKYGNKFKKSFTIVPIHEGSFLTILDNLRNDYE